MRIALFYHSLLSDWNHGNAHFLRGVATELIARGHEVRIFEPRDSWSASNLWKEQGRAPFRNFHAHYPLLRSTRYHPLAMDLPRQLDGCDVVIVHEWNEPALVREIGQLRARSRSFRLYFHDTHHRLLTDPQGMARFDLEHYDGVLAYGEVLKEMYLSSGRVRHAWTWHEAADTRVFRPIPGAQSAGDLVWIGNWGDEERSAELREFLVEPVRALGLKARVYGVRYPEAARKVLQDAGIEYCGWLPNFEVPGVFAQFKVTIHVPRRPYVQTLRGIPTIRPFEALACGIPLISAPWEDAEGLFTPGSDFLVAHSGAGMKQLLRDLVHDTARRRSLAEHGLLTIRRRHTCAHRVEELLSIDAVTRERAAPERRKQTPALSPV
jgi:spore maturation protein CgeB